MLFVGIKVNNQTYRRSQERHSVLAYLKRLQQLAILRIAHWNVQPRANRKLVHSTSDPEHLPFYT